MQSRLIVAFSLGAAAGVVSALGCLQLGGGWRVGEKEEEGRRGLEGLQSDTLLFKYGIPVSPLSSHTYSSHALTYDRARRVPVWTAERLTRQQVRSKQVNREHSEFKPDPVVPPPFTSTNEDYWDSGWSRGHMVPAADCKHSQLSMDESFFLTNVVPQDIDNNGGYWNRLEMFCRDLTNVYDEVRVISGPLFLVEEDSTTGKSLVKYEVIGKSHVAVPTHLYKIVLAESKSSPTAIGVFVVPNKPIGDVNLTKFQVTLQELESHSGTIYHPELDRNKVVDLCTSTGCKLISLEKLAFIRYKQRIRSVQTEEELEKLWKEAENKNLESNDLALLCELYTLRKGELNSEDDSTVNSTSS